MVAATIISVSPAMQRAMALVRQFAPTRMPVLLVGATGTGKEVIAQAIHEASGRTGRLVEVNCAALPRELVEGQLFGHRRGAFSGATADSIGLIEAADRGTLFLDELSSMPPEAPTKLVRVLEESAVTRLGETRPRPVDVRFVAAVQADTRHDLDRTLVRSDLVYRLSGIVIELPPLRQRPMDIVPLAAYVAQQSGRTLDSSAEGILREHDWPGNVRELRLTVERAGTLSSNRIISGVAAAEAIDLGVPPRSVSEERPVRPDRSVLLASLEAAGWNAARAASLLGIGRATLFRRLHAAGLSITDARQSHQSRYRPGTPETPGATEPPGGD